MDKPHILAEVIPTSFMQINDQVSYKFRNKMSVVQRKKKALD
jgi:hypothetical protein